MTRLPQRYAPFIYGIVQAGITTAVASAIATHQLMGFGVQFFIAMGVLLVAGWLTMLPVVIGLAPVIQRAVAALTAPDALDDRG